MSEYKVKYHIALLSGIHKELEEIIKRIAHHACICWVHLIISTQTPETNIVKGIIKTIKPSRVVFYIRGKQASRITWHR